MRREPISVLCNPIFMLIESCIFQQKNGALDFCGQAPKEPENLDPDSAESRLNFPSPFNEVILYSMITLFDLVFY